jgi:hypothetical protein
MSWPLWSVTVAAWVFASATARPFCSCVRRAIALLRRTSAFAFCFSWRLCSFWRFWKVVVIGWLGSASHDSMKTAWPCFSSIAEAGAFSADIMRSLWRLLRISVVYGEPVLNGCFVAVAEEPVAEAFGQSWKPAHGGCGGYGGSGPSNAVEDDADDAEGCERNSENVGRVHLLHLLG